ncbi:MAG: hypothetical protein ACTSYI_15995 [Promethearchaeota archaeon]
MTVEKLKKAPQTWILLVITLLGLIIFLLINQLIFAPLPIQVPSYGILDIEFAWTPGQITTIFTAWGTEGMTLHAAGIYWDFLYILGYGPFIAGLILLLSRKLSGKIQIVGFYMTFAPLLAGLFDVVENILLLTMLNNPSEISAAVPLIAGIMASIKFGLLLLGIGFLLFGLITWTVSYLKNKMKKKK